MSKVIDNIWREMPNNFTFTADTLEKAIVKLHRLNAAQHNSLDDWHLNMMEATKDLPSPSVARCHWCETVAPATRDCTRQL